MECPGEVKLHDLPGSGLVGSTQWPPDCSLTAGLVFVECPRHAYIGGFDFQTVMSRNMKHWLILCLALIGTWLLWSGHFENPLIIGLGALSALFCMWVCADANH